MTLFHSRWAGLLALLLFVLTTGPSLAQTGALVPSEEELQKVPAWQPDPMGTSADYAVDLRDNMPPVGRQRMNDCLAWAAAYAVKSHHEALDQGWKPTTTSTVFSPRFVYNQVNKGQNKGSTILDVAKLLKEKGAATLKTCPYVPGDYKGQPSRLAFEEAKKYRIAGAFLIRDGNKLRVALSQGHPIVLGVRTNPVFNSGSYSVYTQKLHDYGKTKREPGQKHGFHAMVAVGYDDAKQAFLVMNSWGNKWGKDGHCWISYDVAEEFDAKKTGDSLVMYGMLMLDVKEKVNSQYIKKPTKTTDTNTTTTKGYLRVGGTGYRSGYDAATKKDRYFYSSYLVGTTKSLDQVSRVKWTLPSGTKTISLTSSNRTSAFRVTGHTFTNVFSVKATLYYKDRTSKTISGYYKLQAPTTKRDIKLVQFIDDYHGKLLYKGKPTDYWYWYTRIEGNLRDVKDIAKVVYKLPSGLYVNTTRTLTTGAWGFTTGGPARSAHRVDATVYFKDGKTQKLHTYLRLNDAKRDGYTIRTEYQEDGKTDDGKTIYTYRVWIDGSRQDMAKVPSVKWTIGTKVATTWSRGYPEKTYVEYTGTATREFRIDAQINFRSNDPREPIRLSKWVELGPDARYADENRIDTFHRTEYWGVRKGVDKYLATIWVSGDPHTLDRIEKVNYYYPQAFKPNEVEIKRGTNRTFTSTSYITRATPIRVKVQYRDGSTSKFAIELKPDAERDVLYLDGWAAQTRKGDKLPEQCEWDVHLRGPTGQIEDIDHVRYTLPWPYKPRQVVVSARNSGQYGTFGLRRRGPLPTYVYARIAYDSGHYRHLKVRIDPSTGRPAMVEPDKPRVVVKTRFDSFEDDGKPRWDFHLQLEGKTSHVKQVTYRFGSKTAKPYTKTARPDFKMNGTTTSARTCYATIEYTDGKSETQFINVEHQGPRSSDIVLRQRTTTYRRIDSPDRRYWQVFLQGPDGRLDAIKSVALRSSLGRKTSFNSGHGVKWGGYADQPFSVDADITLNDGTTLTRSVKTGFAPVDPHAVGSAKYYGRSAKGTDIWLVTWRIEGSPELVADIEQVDFYGAKSDRVKTCPDFIYEERWYSYQFKEGEKQQAVLKSHRIHYENGEQVYIKHPVVVPLPRPTVQTLVLRKKPSPGNIAFDLGGQAEMTYVDGPEFLIEQIKSIRYTIQGKDGKRTTRYISDREGDITDAFECHVRTSEGEVVDATAYMADKKTRKLRFAQ